MLPNAVMTITGVCESWRRSCCEQIRDRLMPGRRRSVRMTSARSASFSASSALPACSTSYPAVFNCSSHARAAVSLRLPPPESWPSSAILSARLLEMAGTRETRCLCRVRFPPPASRRARRQFSTRSRVPARRRSDLVVKNGLKMFSRCLGRYRDPRSITAISTVSPTCRVFTVMLPLARLACAALTSRL